MECKIGEKTCHIYTRGKSGPILYWPVSHDRGGDEAERLSMRLKTMCPHRAWTIAAFETMNWDSELSPWPARLESGRAFAGDGKSVLQWIFDTQEIIEKEYGSGKRAIGGYSFSGLFALWAFYETGMFDAAGSFSGSLWYPKWNDYASGKKSRRESIIYLSLGTKEEKTKNRDMASVGDATRSQYERILLDENVKDSALVWNGGGHSSEPDMRTARGFAWIIEHI